MYEFITKAPIINSDTQELTNRETRNPQTQDTSNLQPLKSETQLQESKVNNSADINTQASLIRPDANVKVENSKSSQVLASSSGTPTPAKSSYSSVILTVSLLALFILLGTALMWNFNRSAKKIAKRPK